MNRQEICSVNILIAYSRLFDHSSFVEFSFLSRVFKMCRGRETSVRRQTPQQVAGNAAEDAAARWLAEERKFRILDRNWRGGGGELDLIARDGNVLVFVEVRARKAGALVGGYQSVNKRKRETLRKSALNYLRRCRPHPRHFRFDITEVDLNNGIVGELRHYEQVPIFRKHDRPTHS